MSSELTPAKALQLEFWTAFREYVTEHSPVVRAQKPLAQHWLNFINPDQSESTIDEALPTVCRIESPSLLHYTTTCLPDCCLGAYCHLHSKRME